MAKKAIREFTTGATRDTDEGKPDYEAFLSPLVLKRYGEYMHTHRLQKDGSMRDGDNWQKGFGDDHFAVCMKSGWRHFQDWWSLHRGYSARSTIEEAICALMFNAMAYLHWLLKDKES